jgi:biotin carboxyl carrier protein
VSNWYPIDDNGNRTRVAVASGDGATWVFVDGNVWKIEDAPAGRGRARARESSVMAPMPATVVTINIAPGNSVTEGETLIVLEAMKMELPIRAPRSGVVTKVNCAKGDLVQPGVNLLEIE